MNEANNIEFITKIPNSIKEYFKEKNIDKEVLALYFENSKEIQNKIKNSEIFKDRNLIIQNIEITEEQKNKIIDKNKIVVDRSLKLWFRLVGLFSLNDLKELLSSKIFLDVKVYGLEDIIIHGKGN